MRNVTVPAALLISASAVSQPVEILLPTGTTFPTCAAFTIGCTLPVVQTLADYGVRLWPPTQVKNPFIGVVEIARLTNTNCNCATRYQVELLHEVTTTHSWSTTSTLTTSVAASTDLLRIAKLDGRVDDGSSQALVGSRVIRVSAKIIDDMEPLDIITMVATKDDYRAVLTQLGASLSVITQGCGAGEICETGAFTLSAVGDGDNEYIIHTLARKCSEPICDTVTNP